MAEAELVEELDAERACVSVATGMGDRRDARDGTVVDQVQLGAVLHEREAPVEVDGADVDAVSDDFMQPCK